jgi:hypothetical protein
MPAPVFQVRVKVNQNIYFYHSIRAHEKMTGQNNDKGNAN